MLKLLLVVIAVYLAVTAVMYFMQRSMLYHPSNQGLTAVQAEALSLKKWPTESDYRGYLSDTPQAERTIVVFHGNAAEAASRAYYPATLAGTNSRIILAEYPGYGSRTGSPSEEVFVSDARETLALAAEAFPQEPLIIIGESMGAGVASAAVAGFATEIDLSQSPGTPVVNGLVLITPWDSFVNLAQAHYRFLPARWLVLDRYDSVQNLQSFTAPKAIIIAGRDMIVPKKHGNTLYEKIPPAKARYLLDTAGHNDWLNHVDDQWWNELMIFLGSGRNDQG